MESGKGLGDVYFDPVRSRRMNDAIRDLARRENNSIRLIDSNAAFAGPDGYMPKDMTVDGVHLTASAYDKWRAIITEAVELENPGN